MTANVSRRSLLASSAVLAMGSIVMKASAEETAEERSVSPSDVEPKVVDYVYEVSFTPEQWKERLSEEEYRILRQGGTEKKKSSPLWDELRDGAYYCKGCELGVYSSDYKVKLSKGWAFFQHSEPDSVLTGIDLYTNYGSTREKAAMEAHCRRCGSHLGHILFVSGQILHCINGTSLSFTPSV